jgi:hypothetical protein
MQSDNKYPVKVYKYRSWTDENHRNLLLKNHLFFTSPKDFNDPYDYKIPYDFSLLDTDEKIEQYLEKKKIDSESHYLQKDLEQLLKSFEHRLRNELSQVQEHFNALYFDGADKHYGVLSLSERWDSILMWSHYADFHKGYCVGFWEEKLRNTFIATGGRVIYPPENNFPRLSPIGDFLQNMIQESHVKSNDWKYEKEYRLAKVFYPEIPSTEDRIQEFPNNFISEIIIGIRASDKTRTELIQIGKTKGVEVYQSIKKPFKFAMDRQRLL